MKKDYPDWVLRQKTKNTEIREIKGHYYLYRIANVWDKERKRHRKITVEYLGAITPEGLVKRSATASVSPVEFGASRYTLDVCSDIANIIKDSFDDWRTILVMALFRLMYSSPLKNMEFYYDTSYISQGFSVDLNPRRIGEFLRRLGMNRPGIQGFLRKFVNGSEGQIVDLTHVFSLSENVISSTIGYNGDHEYLPQIRLVLLFDAKKHEPSYYRFVVGSIKDVSTIRHTIEESGMANAFLIGDKGFYSEENLRELESSNIRYILPLRRNSALIDYSAIKGGDRSKFTDHFLFEGRVIWHYREGNSVILYLDDSLKTEEERDFLSGERPDLNAFFERQYQQGTIAVVTNLPYSEEKIYGLLKNRVDVEQAFDAFKNVLNADRSYMRDNYQLEGWFLINFVALLLYYRIYNTLLEKGMLNNYSPRDVLLHLSRVFKMEINGKWVTSEIPRKSRLLMEKLGINYM